MGGALVSSTAETAAARPCAVNQARFPGDTRPNPLDDAVEKVLHAFAPTGKVRNKTIRGPRTGQRQHQTGERLASIEPRQTSPKLVQGCRRNQEGPVQYDLGVGFRRNRRQHFAFPETPGMFRQRRRRPPAEFFQPEVEIPFPLSLDPLLLKISRSGGSGRRPLIRRGPTRRARPFERLGRDRAAP